MSSKGLTGKTVEILASSPIFFFISSTKTKQIFSGISLITNNLNYFVARLVFNSKICRSIFFFFQILQFQKKTSIPLIFEMKVVLWFSSHLVSLSNNFKLNELKKAAKQGGVYQGFRLNFGKVSRWLFLSHFGPLLTRATILGAAWSMVRA